MEAIIARTTNEFGGGEIVPAIEAITGIQAPVMADFVAVPFGTVNHEHGERRQIQNLRNNLKSSSGIERIPFNGIDELDTEQGPNGETVHALNTGDSRIRFVGSGWNIFSSGTIGTVLRTLTNNDYVEITFFGTALNLLIFLDNTTTYDWRATVDGGTEGGSLRPTNPSDVLKGNRKTNVILPITSGLDAGVHTVRIRNFNNGAGTDGFTLYGCEIINENAAIQQQPGADFDGRVEALSGTTFPIEPDDSTVPSVNGRNLDGDAATYGTHADGARVLNYLTSGGQYKQSFNLADEAPVVQVAGEQEYIIEIQNGGSSSVTLPTSVTNFILNAYGAGGGGGGSTTFKEIISPPFVRIAFGGGGGGGGGQAQATFVRDTSTQAETIALSVPGTASGGAGGIFVAGVGGSNGGNTTVTVGGTQIAFGGGAAGGFGGTTTSGGGGGNAGGFSTATFTGWNISSAGGNTGANGSAGSGESKNSNSSGISDANGPGGSGGSVGGVGNSPLISPEGNGGGGGSPQVNGSNGNTPGGGAGGGGSQSNSSGGAAANGGIGEAGRVYLVVTGAAGLTNTSFGVTTGEFTAGSLSGAALGATTAIFGNATFDANRLNQQVIRRINFREFGANSQWAILSGTSPTTLNAFTLNDGTTTLSGNCQQTTQDGLDILSFANNANFVTLTFVGTGLDIFRSDSANGGDDNYAVLVDGLSIGRLNAVTVGSTTTHPGSRIPRITPIVSGLAYGTHTVQFDRVAASTYDLNIADFIIYGPKKPEIPTLDVGSLELSDYNIMADYDRLSANRAGGVSKGVVTKSPGREFIYIPHDTVIANRWGYADDTSLPFGARAAITNATAVARYTFYGTGIEFLASSDATGLPTKGIGLILPGSSTEVRLDRTNFSITYQKIIDITAVTSTSITVSFGTNSTADVNAFIATDVITFDDASASTATVSSVNTSTGVITIDALPSGITATNNVVQIAQQGSSSTPVTVGQVEGSYFGRTTNSSFSVANGANPRIQVSGLPLGVTTARLFNTGNEVLRILGANIITPIHINDDNLKVGSEGLNNLTIDPVVEEDEAVVQANLGEAKAWVHYDGANGTILSSYNIAAVLHVGSPGGGTTTWAPFIYFDKPFKDRDYVAIATPSLRGGGGGGDSVITFGATSQANFATFSVVARLFSASTSVSGGIVVAFYGELIDE